MQEFNSKSFEFNSNGLNKDEVFEVSKNVEIFGGAPKGEERIIVKVRESKHEEEKATGFNMHVCCDKFQINGI